MVGLEACVGLRSVTVARPAQTGRGKGRVPRGIGGVVRVRERDSIDRGDVERWVSTSPKLWVNDNALREIDAVTSLESLRELNAARNELRVDAAGR